MCVRVLLEKTLPLQCQPNVPIWNLSFFDKALRQDSGNSALKEIQDAIVDSLPPYPQFIDPASQQIGFRPPQFMTQFSQTLDLDHAFVLNIRRKGIEPLQYRDPSLSL